MENITLKLLKESQTYDYDISLMNRAYGSDKFIHNLDKNDEVLTEAFSSDPNFSKNLAEASFVKEKLEKFSHDKIDQLKK